jgi:N-acetylmuramoyl-L-alanine amidase
MPAALAEIAFMSNPDDMARLKTPEFRQKAAEALCKSILQALEEMD